MISPRLHISLFGTKFHSFHFFGVIGFIVGTAMGVWLAKYFALNPWYVLLMSGVGAATFFLLTIISKILFGKEIIVYYHHEISILIFCSLVLKLIHVNVLAYLDITILGIGLFLAFGRIGCFSVGCCHGRPSKHGVTYGHDHVISGFTDYFQNVKLFPVQLIESAFVFLIVAIGVWIMNSKASAGTVLIVYTVIYGMFRFVLEFFRGDPERPYWQGLSEAQWTTIILITVTWLLARMNLLPYYPWHSIVMLLLFSAAAYITLFGKSQTSFRIFNARHMRQIAFALAKLSKEKSIESGNPGVTNISLCTTSQGLTFSKGIFTETISPIVHYTVSSKMPGNKLNLRTVKKLARLVQLIQKETEPCEIIQRQTNLFHIVYGNTNKANGFYSGDSNQSGLFYVQVEFNEQ
ncbi:MAG: hypothetical protein C5B52_17415 [Bacteroidetes bacterium]|nr:MAG: hypothetical protein C5B52_17415 [Bacteroidota bacterium]